MGRVAARMAFGVKLFFQIVRTRYVDKSIPDRSPPQVSHGRAPVEIMLLLGLVKTRGKRKEEGE